MIEKQKTPFAPTPFNLKSLAIIHSAHGAEGGGAEEVICVHAFIRVCLQEACAEGGRVSVINRQEQSPRHRDTYTHMQFF